MTAVEEIQAAIDKLTGLKAESTPGPWFLTYERATHPRVWGNADEDNADQVATLARSPRDADLIVTLHRTIDAQLAILTAALDFAQKYELSTSASISPDSPSMVLAAAINGGVA